MILLALSISLGILQLLIAWLSQSKLQGQSVLEYVPIFFTLLSPFIIAFLNEAIVPFLLIFLSSLVLIRSNLSFREYLSSTMIFFGALSSLSLIRWLLYPFITTPFYLDLSWAPSKIGKDLFYLLSAELGPLLVTALILSWALGVGCALLRKIKSVDVSTKGLRLSVDTKYNDDDPKGLVEGLSGGKLLSYLFDARIAFAVSLVALLYLSYCCYLPSLNPLGKPVSFDIMYNYVPTLKTFESLGLSPLSTKAMVWLFKKGGERPFLILSLYYMNRLIGLGYVDTVKLSLFLAGVFLVISTYYVLKVNTGENLLPSASMYFTTFSIATVVGLYAGYLSMWISASFQLLSLAFLTKAVGDEKPLALIPAIALSALAFLSHPWSWAIFALAVFGLLIANFLLSRLRIRKSYTTKQRIIIAAFVLVHLIPAVMAPLVIGVPSTIDLIYTAFKWGTGSILNLFQYSENIGYMLTSYVGGFTNNFLIFSLSIIGAISLLKYDRLLFSFLFCALVVVTPVFFLCDYRPETRILYFLPLQITSTLGSFEILKAARGMVGSTAGLSTVVLLLANYGFRSVANLI